MKNVFKPIGLAAAVAAVTAGYAGVASAQGMSRAAGNLGDLAIVPYYTVTGDWITGVHIINSSEMTQVVKLRMRRGSDSADAMDFNLILSPYDEWTGYIDDSSGKVTWNTDDNSCTAPLRADGVFEMPPIFAEGATEGYIEVIGMGSPVSETQPIAIAAKHDSDGVPFDCKSVESNFFKAGTPAKSGVANSDLTYQAVADSDFYPTCADGASICSNSYMDGGNALKVSYFFRNAAAGTEMGGNAVHVADFSPGESWMSNQESGLFSGDVTGFDYPDLNGGVLGYQDARGLYNGLRQSSLLGVSTVLNDWSVNPALNVSTEWVITMPGQYTMVDYTVWALAGFDPANCGKLDDPNTAVDDGVPLCDFRDIPVIADLTLYDREEGVIAPEEGDLVISPAPPGTENKLIFPYEVNVVEWSDGSTEPVFGSDYSISVDPSPLGVYGWASLSVTSTPKTATNGNANGNGQAVCEFVPPPPNGPWATPSNTARNGGTPLYPTNDDNVCIPATGNVPILGFVGWQRSFPANPDANYGRLVEHSFSSY